MAEKSRVLVIGGTGYIGKFIVEASARAGHPTFALVRESTVSDPVKGQLVDKFKSLGVTLVHVRTYVISVLISYMHVLRIHRLSVRHGHRNLPSLIINRTVVIDD